MYSSLSGIHIHSGPKKGNYAARKPYAVFWTFLTSFSLTATALTFHGTSTCSRQVVVPSQLSLHYLQELKLVLRNDMCLTHDLCYLKASLPPVRFSFQLATQALTIQNRKPIHRIGGKYIS